ncbi:TadE/TadG family type IV pilus assembly protein [Ralstonia solanacearum]|uniref:TadE/TadG family type IV pilus assembly protein n=1 Tax=Ralstonia solanacearum TaxID=305 RepID=UPI0001D98339|nr:TadE/TadG family type IV pilus assembly protein [Ralstonia solanacearum]CBJ52068.1 putative pilus related protein, TadE-like [Ralstonia solanacearum PSI07]
MRLQLHRNAALPCAARRRMAGAAAVEFTLLFPLLLLVVFGVIEFGTALYDKSVITNASREAARAGIVLRQTPMTGAAIQTVATNYCQNRLVTYGAAANCTVPTPTPCPSNSSAGTPLKVEVDYTFNGLALGPLLAPFTGPLTLNAVTTMLCE